MDLTADIFGSLPCGNKSLLHRNDLQQVLWNQRMKRCAILRHDIGSLSHDNKPFPHGFDSFPYRFNCATIGFRPLTIAFVLKTSDLKALRYCSAPDSCALAADPGFFAPDRCGHGVEKTVHEVWTVHLQPTTIQPKKEK